MNKSSAPMRKRKAAANKIFLLCLVVIFISFQLERRRLACKSEQSERRAVCRKSSLADVFNDASRVGRRAAYAPT
jgi:hypothetical protein